MNILAVTALIWIVAQTPTPTPTPPPQSTLCVQPTQAPTRTKMFGTPKPKTPTPPADCETGKYHSINYFWGQAPGGEVTITNPTKFKLEQNTPYWAAAIDLDGQPLQNAPVTVSLSCLAGISGSFTTNTDGEGNFSYGAPFAGQICSLYRLTTTLPAPGILHIQGVELMEDCQTTDGEIVSQPTPTPTPAPTVTPHYYAVKVAGEVQTWTDGNRPLIGASVCASGDTYKGVVGQMWMSGGVDVSGMSIYDLWIESWWGGVTQFAVGYLENHAELDPDLYPTLGFRLEGRTPRRKVVDPYTMPDYFYVWTYDGRRAVTYNIWGVCYGQGASTPTPTPTPTMTPTPTQTPTPPTCGNPANGPVIVPTGPQTCTIIVPEWHFTIPTVNTLFGSINGGVVGWDGVQVCAQYWVLNFPTVFGISVSQILVAFGGVSIAIYTQRRMDN